ncbi:MAG: prolipoprotein diacylglyceryl transferase [Oscillospiraceae bacterium]|nr:prolipoprotein diacylglyceryl transferase [Oscillospiraceae bacterium]
MEKHILEFPGLGLAFELRRVAFSVFGMHIYWYGLILFFAVTMAGIYAWVRAKGFGQSEDSFLFFITFAFVGGVIGARAYYVAFEYKAFQSFSDVLNFRAGGIAIYGALIGGVIAMFITSRCIKEPLLPALDLFANAALLGQAIGRWGNFVNMDTVGKNTNLPWRMTSLPIQRDLFTARAHGLNVSPELPVHPCFLYESIWCLIGFLVVAFYAKRRKFDGELLLIYMMWYGFGRGLIESLRIDSLMFMGFRVSQVLSILLFVTAWIVWRRGRKRVVRGSQLQGNVV